MWQSIIIGTFMVVQHGTMTVNNEPLQMTAAFGGSVSLTTDGFSSEEDCKNSLPRPSVKSFTLKGLTIYVTSSECKEVPNTGEKSKS